MTAVAALRFNQKKPRLGLVPASLTRYVGAGMTYGAEKYGDNNWRKGFNWVGLIDSLERHIAAFKEGEDIDAESGLPHLAHVGCNVAFLIEHFDAQLGIDDRVKADVARVLLSWTLPVEKVQHKRGRRRTVQK